MGFGADDVDVNTEGWPVASGGNNGAPTDADCAQLWTALLQGSAPSVAVPTATTDYEAEADTNGCTYTYRLDGRTATSTPSSRTIVYNAVNGVVTTNAD
ncbi:hypothetical protein D3C84_983110 [compost metagenome]